MIVPVIVVLVPQSSLYNTIKSLEPGQSVINELIVDKDTIWLLAEVSAGEATGLFPDIISPNNDI